MRIKQNELLKFLSDKMGVKVEGIEIKLWQYSGNKGRFAKLFRIEKIEKESQQELDEAKIN